MKKQAIRELSAPEIEKALLATRNELLQMKIRKQVAQLETPHRIRELRRTVARLETIKNEKAHA